jgi:hypothetical protein
MYLAPEEVILLLKINFERNIQSQEMADIIRDLRQTIQHKFPHYKHLFIEPV